VVKDHLNSFLLDRMAARGAVNPATVDLFVSPHDSCYDSVLRLEAGLQRFDWLDARLHVADYPSHAEMREPFFAFMRERLAVPVA